MSAFIGQVVHYFLTGNAAGERPKAAIVTEVIEGGRVGITLFPLHFLPYHHSGIVTYIGTAGATNSSEFCCPAAEDASVAVPVPPTTVLPDPAALNSAIEAADAPPAPDTPPATSAPVAANATGNGAPAVVIPTATPDGSGAPSEAVADTAPAGTTDSAPASTSTAPVDTGTPPA